MNHATIDDDDAPETREPNSSDPIIEIIESSEFDDADDADDVTLVDESDADSAASSLSTEGKSNAAQAATAQQANEAAGPMVVELIATRAELRRVEGELQQKTEELQKLEIEQQDSTGKQARLQADFENFRRRAERARGETYGQIVGEVVGKLLPVVDNLRRALELSAATEANSNQEFQQFTDGVELIVKQLSDVLQSYGVEEVPAIGAKFDPHVHEAIAIEQTDAHTPDTITAEIQRGYKLGDKLLRPAMVKVAK